VRAVRFYEQMEQLKDGLDEARAQGDQTTEATALYQIGRIYFQDQANDAARDYWEQCETVCRESGQSRELVQVLLDLGDLDLRQADPARAEVRFQEALAIQSAEDLPRQRAPILDRLGRVALEKGRSEQALAIFQEALDLCREHGDRIGSLYFLEQIIPVYKHLGQVDHVEPAYRDMITLAEKLGDRERMCLGLVGLADLYQRIGQPQEAIPYLTLAHDKYLLLGKTQEAGLVRREIERIGGPIKG